MTVLLFDSAVEYRSAKDDYALADMLKETLFEHAALRDQYFLHREERTREQWEKVKIKTDQLIRRGEQKFDRIEAQHLLNRLRINVEERANIFRRIVSHNETMKSAPGSSPIRAEFERRLYSQLLLRAAEFRDLAIAFEDHSAQRVEQTYRRLLAAFGAFAALLAMSAILVARRINRLMRRRLKPLHEGATAIANGDLTHRIASEGNDEFADLARSLNAMTGKLQTFTGRLEAEIAAHARTASAKDDALQRLQRIASRVPGMVFEYRLRADGSSCFPYASEAIRDIYRVGPEEVLEDASKCFAVLHPDDRDGIVASIRQSADQLTPWQQEYRVRFDDGTVRWLFGNSLPQREADGATLWHGFTTDITERKQAEAELRESRDRLSRVVAGSDQCFWDWDLQTNAFTASTRFDTMLGFAPGENDVSVERWPEIVHTDDLAAARRSIERHLAGDTPRHEVEVRCRAKSGGWHWLLTRGRIVESTDDGRPKKMSGTFTDINERKQMQLALAESEQLFRQVYLNSPIGIAILAADGTLLRANPALCRVTGRAEPELTGLTMAQLTIGSCRQRDERLLAELISGHEPGYTIEQPLIDAHLNERLVRCTTTAFRDAGRTLTMISLIEDITERKLAESADLAVSILSAQETERARLSHELHDEIGQTLTALSISLRRAQQRHDPSDASATFAPAKSIIEHLTADVRRIAHRLRPTELDELGLVAALRSHIDKLPRPAEMSLVLEENVGRLRLPPAVELCCFRIAQEALTNCLRHARARAVSVALTCEGHKLQLRVRDDGIGFDVERTLQTLSDAASLGLIGMRERVFGAGGQISFRSAAGAGSEITATFHLEN